MNIRHQNNDRLVIALVSLAIGAILAATGAAAFIAAAKQNSGVSRFLLGYTLLWSGLVFWIQHSNAKSLINMMNSFGNSRKLASSDTQNAEQGVAGYPPQGVGSPER